MLTESFFVALAAMLKADPPFPGELFIAVGGGEAAWDQAPPPYDRGVTDLVQEVARQVVRPQDIVFLDGEGGESPLPTSRLRLRTIFVEDEAVGTLRECGLFGGDATVEPGSGTLLAYYVHPRLEKTPEMTLVRSLHIDLTPTAYAPGARMTRYLGNSNSREFHDLENLTANCQVNEIRMDHRFYLASIEQAAEMGYDFCAYCFGAELSTG